VSGAAVATAPSPGPAAARPLRVAVISYGLPRVGFKRGGIERVAHELADGLARRGHRVTVFSHDPKPQGAGYDVRELPWRRFMDTWVGRRATMGYLGNVLALATDVGDAEIVMAHGDSLLLPLRRRPVIRVMHGSALEEARSATSVGRTLLQAGVYGLELLTSLGGQTVVAVSPNTRRFNPLIHHVIPNGVDLRLFRPDAAARAAAPEILFVGAMGGRKRGAWLIDQFVTRIRPRRPDAQLHLVTDPGLPTPGVTFHTGLSDQALARLYRRAWVYASPSTYEGFGLPYLEAMASGTPVVATPNEGSRELLDANRFGRLADDDEFSAAVLGLLADPSHRAAMAAAGLERAAHYSLDRTIDAYEALMLDMVHRG
jgi:phosphatidylinositol alpha-mannosyltransferase